MYNVLLYSYLCCVQLSTCPFIVWNSTDPFKKKVKNYAPIMNNKVVLYCIIGPYIIIMVDWALKTSVHLYSYLIVIQRTMSAFPVHSGNVSNMKPLHMETSPTGKPSTRKPLHKETSQTGNPSTWKPLHKETFILSQISNTTTTLSLRPLSRFTDSEDVRMGQPSPHQIYYYLSAVYSAYLFSFRHLQKESSLAMNGGGEGSRGGDWCTCVGYLARVSK